MSRSESLRISIPTHHRQYLQNLAAQMGTTPVEALNLLFWELRKQGYSFTSQIPLPKHLTQPETLDQLTQSGLAFVPSANDLVVTDDLVINRFLEIGLESF